MNTENNKEIKPLNSPLSVPFPLSSEACEQSLTMAQRCPNIGHQEQLQRYLLTTIVLKQYLNMLGYLTDLEDSDCWHSIFGRIGEVADVYVSQIGRIECCAFEHGSSTAKVLADGQFNRVAYMAIEIDLENQWGFILGYQPGGNASEAFSTLNRDELTSMDEFGDFLQRRWLLWQFFQKRTQDELWEPDQRMQVITLLERSYQLEDFEREYQAKDEVSTSLGAQEGELVEMGERSDMQRRYFEEKDEISLLDLIREAYDFLDDELKT